MNSDKKRYHLWISDEKVEVLDKKLRGFSEDRGVDYCKHGTRLSQGLKDIIEAYSRLENDTLSQEDIIIFKMVLPEGEDIYAKRDIAEKEGLKINAIKDKTHAIVSTNKNMFHRLQERVGTYRDSGNLKHFQYLEGFEPFGSPDKQALSLKRYLQEEKDNLYIDVQLMFVPNLPANIQERAAKRIIDKIIVLESKAAPKQYNLSDGTTVIRANVPIKELRRISDDSIIYRVEQTGFFRVTPSSVTSFDASILQLDPDISIDDLPLVAVLDSGVRFPDDFSELVPIHWRATGVTGQGTAHGTGVASKVIFSHIGLQLTDSFLKPRARVIDCDIYGADNQVSQEVMAQRIEQAVISFHDLTKIFNLSSNVNKAIDGDELSILGYQLDSLMRKYRIKFVISAGNHQLASVNSDLISILEDTDARIAEPADSMLGITVGAIAGVGGPHVYSQSGEPTAYTRIGPGFAGFYKPDLVAYAGNLRKDLQTARDPYSFLLGPDGKIVLDIGTSFSAPVVAGDLAEISAIVPGNDILLAQALLYNGAERFWDTKGITKEEAILLGYQYGRGLSSTENCKYSESYRVTFLRSGSLKRATKERVKFHMPTLQASVKGNNITKVTVTCITDSPIDKTKGEQYLGACITASLHKLDTNGKISNGNPKVSDNKGKWDTCNHFSTTFSSFSGGEWEVWLDLFTKWDIDEDMEIPYSLVITIEDLTRSNDIYHAVIEETAGQFRPVETVRVAVRN